MVESPKERGGLLSKTGPGIRVMVVDDDQSVCDTVRMILEGSGYEVKTCLTAESALRACKRNAFHIVLLDIKMPHVSGTDLLCQLRQADRNMGVIMMTAYPNVATAAETMRAGGRDYITKPFTEQQLLDAVGRLCAEMGLVYSSEKDLIELVGHRIRNHRQQRRMTLQQLSERASITASQLSQVELGKSAPSMWTLARVSSALGIRLSKLVEDL